MRIVRLFALLLSFLSITSSAFTQNKKQKNYIPWSNGELLVSEEGRYLKHQRTILQKSFCLADETS